jgi:hypothetical protein
LGEGDLVTAILCRERMLLTFRIPVLVRHLAVLVANAEGDPPAFAAPPADWIVWCPSNRMANVSKIVTGKVSEPADL